MATKPTLDQIRKQVIGKQQTFQNFAFTINREADVDLEARTVKLAFASDKPIDNWWYGKIELQMGKKNVRTVRLDSGAPLLMDHNTRDVVGVIRDYSFDSDGIARCTVEFGESVRAEEVFQDVRKGIRQNVSVGFMIWELNLKSDKKGETRVYTADDWEPYEVSIVAVPADVSVGIGRGLDDDACEACGEDPCICEPADDEEVSDASRQQRAISTKEENKMTPEEIAAAAAAEEAARNQRTPAQIAREEISEAANALGKPELAPAFHQKRLLDGIESEPTLNEFKAFARTQIPANVPVPVMDPTTAARMGGGGQDTPVQLATSNYRGGALKAFKGENHLERAHRAGMFFLAALGKNARALAFCQEKGLIRAHSGELNSTGGVLVPDELDQNIIDLRIQYGTFRRNASVAAMASDTLVRPRRTGGLTAYFTGGGDAATESTKSWDSITLVAKKLSVLTKYENELSEDAVINIADDLTSEIAYAFANKEDECGFNGTGAATYGGMVGVCPKLQNLSATRANIAGLHVAAAGHDTWPELDLADIQGVVSKLPQFARQSGNVKWYCSHEFYATVLMRLAQAVGGVTATEIQNGFGPSFFGIPVEITEVMPHTTAADQVCLLYGNLAQAATLGDRRGTSIAMTDSDSTDFAKGIMAIRGDTRFDINVHDVGNATATAADKTPGPIVGLATIA